MYLDDYDKMNLLGDNFNEVGGIFDKVTTDKQSDDIKKVSHCRAAAPGNPAESEIQKIRKKGGNKK